MWTDWEEESHVVEHYRGLHNNRPSVTWPEVLEKALEGQPSSVALHTFKYACLAQLTWCTSQECIRRDDRLLADHRGSCTAQIRI